MLGVLYIPGEIPEATADYVGPFIDLVNSFGDYFALNEAAYVAQFAVVTNQTEADWAVDAFDFCGFDCGLLNMRVSDTYSTSINGYYYQLNNGSCNNPIDVANW